MFLSQVLIGGCFVLSIATAALSASASRGSVFPSAATGFRNHIITTQLSVTRSADELRRKRDVDRYLCGTKEGGTGRTNFCVTTTASCAATILPDGHAYQYCSNSAFVTQKVITTALASWNSEKPCPTNAKCCTDPASPAVKTILFVASGYTISGWGCNQAEATYTFEPYAHLLDPASFSTSLAHVALTRSTSITAQPSQRASTGSRNKTPVLSSGAEIGIGVAAGVGVGVIIIASIAIFHRRKRRYRVVEMDNAYIIPLEPQEMDGEACKPKNYFSSQIQELPG